MLNFYTLCLFLCRYAKRLTCRIKHTRITYVPSAHIPRSLKPKSKMLGIFSVHHDT